MERVIELDVPIERKEVVFKQGVKFERYFSVQPTHKQNVAPNQHTPFQCDGPGPIGLLVKVDMLYATMSANRWVLFCSGLALTMFASQATSAQQATVLRRNVSLNDQIGTAPCLVSFSWEAKALLLRLGDCCRHCPNRRNRCRRGLANLCC
jgi:hypothetical protein